MLGDDAALLPRQNGQLLLACEGMHPGLVEDDPWFAGWSGVLVNLSDIAAMGGRPLALVNSVWSQGPESRLSYWLECDSPAIALRFPWWRAFQPAQSVPGSVGGCPGGRRRPRAPQPGRHVLAMSSGCW